MSVEIVKQILASDIIGWLLAFLGGILAFRVIDNMQTNIERHTVIKDVENTLNQLYSSKLAKIYTNLPAENKSDDKQEKSDVMIRTVLDDKAPWKMFEGQDDVEIVDGQRYIQIRNEEKYKEYLSTQAIHELEVLFRRIEKLYKNRILKPIDLADMWRELLPFAVSGRLDFYYSYLGESDVKSIIFVLFNTLLACKKYEIKNAVSYFCSKYNNESAINKLYLKNNRFTWKERLRVHKFQNIIMLGSRE